MPARRILSWPFLLSCVALAGCAWDRDPAQEQMDQLWRQGYSFNNPNPDRMKHGLAPLNFDGTPSR